MCVHKKKTHLPMLYVFAVRLCSLTREFQVLHSILTTKGVFNRAKILGVNLIIIKIFLHPNLSK